MNIEFCIISVYIRSWTHIHLLILIPSSFSIQHETHAVKCAHRCDVGVPGSGAASYLCSTSEHSRLFPEPGYIIGEQSKLGPTCMAWIPGGGRRSTEHLVLCVTIPGQQVASLLDTVHLLKQGSANIQSNSVCWTFLDQIPCCWEVYLWSFSLIWNAFTCPGSRKAHAFPYHHHSLLVALQKSPFHTLSPQNEAVSLYHSAHSMGHSLGPLGKIRPVKPSHVPAEP